MAAAADDGGGGRQRRWRTTTVADDKGGRQQRHVRLDGGLQGGRRRAGGGTTTALDIRLISLPGREREKIKKLSLRKRTFFSDTVCPVGFFAPWAREIVEGGGQHSVLQADGWLGCAHPPLASECDSVYGQDGSAPQKVQTRLQ
jgi:hypothetical protein